MSRLLIEKAIRELLSLLGQWDAWLGERVQRILETREVVASRRRASPSLATE